MWLLLRLLHNPPKQPFGKLRVNGACTEIIDFFTFVLSLSKHENRFVQQALLWKLLKSTAQFNERKGEFMSKKFILHGMGIGKRRLKGLMWAVVLLCYSLLPSPLYARAEMCSEIDYDITTIAAGTYHVLCIKEDGTVVGTGVAGMAS